MQIVMMASGTRGDVQPMIALGKGLKSAGHQVRLVAGSNFVDWIKSHGLDVYPTVDIEKLMHSELGIKWIQSESQREQLAVFKDLTNSLMEETIHDTIEGTAGADFMIGGFLAQPYMQAISQKHHIPLVTAALQPFRPTTSGAASIVPLLSRRTSILNRWMGYLAERFTWSVVEATTNELRRHLDLPAYTARTYSQHAAKIPALYAISPQVVPPTTDTNSYTSGYWFLDEDFSPPDDLLAFLEAGTAPIYFGFGSMPDSNPAQTLTMLNTALTTINRRGILVSGWSQMPDNPYSDRIFLLTGAPHHWLFPRMAALVHHGGAGTSAAGLRAGKVSLLIPHMGDQPYWAGRLYDLGVSAKPLKRKDLNAQSLSQRLQSLVDDSGMQTRVTALSYAISAEDGTQNASEWLKHLM